MKVQSPVAEGPCMTLMPGVVVVGQKEAGVMLGEGLGSGTGEGNGLVPEALGLQCFQSLPMRHLVVSIRHQYLPLSTSGIETQP